MFFFFVIFARDEKFGTLIDKIDFLLCGRKKEWNEEMRIGFRGKKEKGWKKEREREGRRMSDAEWEALWRSILVFGKGC